MAATPGDPNGVGGAGQVAGPVQGVWRLDGESWVVGLNGQRIPVRDTKGARHLRELLGRPGVELSAMELVAAVGGLGGDQRPTAGGETLELSSSGDLGAALDPEAKHAYRQRLRELDEEAEEAERFNDPERAAKARDEAEFLMHELSAAVGLRGRDRPQGAASERARINVTRSIRAAIERAAQHDDQLGKHLRGSIRTGAFCRYEPVYPVVWELEEGPAAAGGPDVANELPAGAALEGRAMQAVLFIDVVGSTQAAVALGDRRWSELLERHGELVRERAAAHGVRLVKLMGDGALLLADAPSSAVVCAFDLVEGARELGLELRAGVHAGECTLVGDDVAGVAVHIGARVGALAAAGEVLVSATVRELMAGGDLSFEDRGVHSLRGLPGTWRVYAAAAPLTRPPEPSAAPAVIPLPARLTMAAPTTYVGRETLRALLGEAWADVRQGRRRIVLLGGEPGIGKTRLSTEVALECHDDGGAALYGGCEPDTALAYAPWAAALDHLVTYASAELLDRHVAHHGGHLARLVPELRARVPDLREPPAGDPEADRLLLYSAMSGLIVEAAAERPLVLVLDDLHWADAASLAVLRHLVVAASPAPMLLLGTYRHTEVDGNPALADFVALARREPDVESISIAGLAQREVLALLESAAGHDLETEGRELAARLHADTEGNPFFVVEMLRDLTHSGALRRGDDGRWRIEAAPVELEAPESVRDVIARRIEQLGEPAVEALTIAAVIGRSFELGLLCAASGRDDDDLVEVLDRAVTASVVAEAPGSAERFMFTHALMVHTLYDRLSQTRRARLHRRVAEALEAMCGKEPGQRIAELAHHWGAAVPAGDAGKAIGYAERAARRALDDFAPAEALRWYRRALELHRKLPDPPPEVHVDLLTGLGEAQRRAGDAGFRTTLLEASAGALALDDAGRLAAAALANTRGYHSNMGIVDAERIAMLEAALERIASHDPRRALLLALLAAERLWDRDVERRIALSDEALALARASDDAGVLGQVLSLRFFAIWAPWTLQERVANVDELTELAERLDDPFLGFFAHVWRYMAYVQTGDPAEVERSLQRQRHFAAVLGQPGVDMVRLIQEGSWTIALGDYEETERLAGEALQVGRAAGEPDVEGFCAGMICAVRVEQRRAGEMVETLAGAVAAFPTVAQFRALLAQARLDAGDAAGARAMLDAESADGFAAVPVDPTVTATLVGWADVTARLGAVEHAPTLLELLEPSRGQQVFQATMALGPVTRYTACLLALLDRFDEAAEDFAAALESAERIGGEAFAARTRAEHAALLLRRDAHGDHEVAGELATEAARIAAERGYAPTAALATDVLNELRIDPAPLA